VLAWGDTGRTKNEERRTLRRRFSPILDGCVDLDRSQ
jgi:hypothetical protein